MTESRGDSDPIHPGEILQAEFLAPHGLSRARLARATGLASSRLARVFRPAPQFWLNLQVHHDLARAQAQLAPAQVARAKAFGDRLQRARRRP